LEAVAPKSAAPFTTLQVDEGGMVVAAAVVDVVVAIASVVVVEVEAGA